MWQNWAVPHFPTLNWEPSTVITCKTNQTSWPVRIATVFNTRFTWVQQHIPRSLVKCEVYQWDNRDRNKSQCRGQKRRASFPKRLEKGARQRSSEIRGGCSRWHWFREGPLRGVPGCRGRQEAQGWVRRRTKEEQKDWDQTDKEHEWSRAKWWKQVDLPQTQRLSFHFLVTDTFLSLPKVPMGLSLLKHQTLDASNWGRQTVHQVLSSHWVCKGKASLKGWFLNHSAVENTLVFSPFLC